MKMDKILRNKERLILLFLIIAGGILRGLCIGWGGIYELHPDEPIVVNNAIDLLRRNSYEVLVYYRPDHFEIKCCAFLFNIFSWIKFHIPAEEAFELHGEAFRILARLFTMFWGILIIPLVYRLLSKISTDNKNHSIGLIGAALVALDPIFIQHSVYATPDIPLTFMVLSVALLSIDYIRTGDKKVLYAISALTGIAILIKYTGAICCIWIAVIVLIRQIRDKKYYLIFYHGIISIVTIAVVIFVFSPNIYTDFGSVIEAFRNEASKVNHLGIQNLGYFGNIQWYFTKILDDLSYISLLPFFYGLYKIFKSWTVDKTVIFIGFLFNICLSILKVHWERWGLPIYLTYIFVIAIGMGNVAVKYRDRPIIRKLDQIILLFIIINLLLLSVAVVKNSKIEDARIIGKEFCDSTGIKKENSIYEGYTPLIMLGGTSCVEVIEISDEGELIFNNSAENRNWIVLGGLRDRYLAEKENYQKEAAVYNAIDEQCNLVFSAKVTEPPKNKNIINSLKECFEYLLAQDIFSGNSVYIYEITERD